MSEPKKEETPKEAIPIGEWPNPGGHEGYDGPVIESDEQKKAKRDFENQYGDPTPTVETDEYGDPIDGEDDADPELLDAARVLSDPLATSEERDEARETLLASPGLEEYGETDDGADDEPTTRAERIAEIAEGTRLGNQPIDPYANPKMDGGGSVAEAVKAVARESALQRKVHELLRTPGHTQEHRSESERRAIRAVREAMLRQRGIESADLDNPPSANDDFFAESIAQDDAATDEELGLPPGTTAAQFEAAAKLENEDS